MLDKFAAAVIESAGIKIDVEFSGEHYGYDANRLIALVKEGIEVAVRRIKSDAANRVAPYSDLAQAGSDKSPIRYAAATTAHLIEDMSNESELPKSELDKLKAYFIQFMSMVAGN